MRRGFALFLAALFVAALPVAGQAQQAPAAAPKITITPYGFVLFTTHFNAGNYAAQDFPASVSPGPGNGSFLMTARGSRFGFKIGVPDDPFTGAKVSAVIEMDFKSGQVGNAASGAGSQTSAAFNQAIPRLRLAYAQASWGGPDSKFTLLAGQDWGVIAPVMGTSLAFGADPIFAQAGNLWRRSPQIRASYDLGMGALGFNFQVAALNPADANTPADNGIGNKSRLPNVEARAAVLYKQGAKKVAEVGVSGHYDWRRYVLGAGTVSARNVDANGRAVALDAQFNLPFVTVQGEAFANDGAQDSTNALNGTAQLAPPTQVLNALNQQSQGFWAQAVIKPIPQVQIPVGYGVEQTRYKGIPGIVLPAGTRTNNAIIHAGLLFNMTNPWKFGLEYVHTISQYQAEAGTGSTYGGVAGQQGMKALTADSFILTSKLDF